MLNHGGGRCSGRTRSALIQSPRDGIFEPAEERPRAGGHWCAPEILGVREAADLAQKRKAGAAGRVAEGEGGEGGEGGRGGGADGLHRGQGRWRAACDEKAEICVRGN